MRATRKASRSSLSGKGGQCLVKGGDHRLSSDADLARLTRTLDALLEAVDP